MISWMIAIGVLVGMADSLTGNHFKIGETFQRGFRLIGSMMISMAGIMALAPVIAGWIAPLILPLFRQLQMDPSIVSILMGNDMGGYQMAKSLAEDPQVGMMLGGITAGMFGGTLTFSIPLGFSLIQGDARKSFSKGMLIGIGCIPVGSIAGGLVLGIAPSKVLWNNIPVLFLTVLIVLGFVCMQDRLVKIMEIFGKIIEWTGTIGIGIGAFTYLTGIVVIPGMLPIMDTMQTVCGMTVTMIGMFPVLEIFRRVFQSLLDHIGNLVGMGADGCSGIIFTLASAAPVFPMLNDMNETGAILNAAWIVGCAATFGSQMGLIMSIGSEYIPAFLTAKFACGFTALAAAIFYTWHANKNKAEN